MGPIHVAIDAAEHCKNILYFDFSKVCLERTEWASWVQAVGALIAIIFTAIQILLSRLDAKKNAKEKKQIVGAAISDLEVRSAQAIVSLVWQIQASWQASQMLLDDPLHSTLLDVQELARTIRLQDLPDPESVLKVLKILETVGAVRKIYMKTGALLKDRTDRLSQGELENFQSRLNPYIGQARLVPGVIDNN
jgi:hypothetical protein